MIETGYLQVAMAVVLAAIAFILTRMNSIPVEKEIAFGTVRAFIQLIAVGYILEFIFASDSIWLIVLSVMIMMLVAAYTAGKRAEHYKNGFMISFISLSVGSLVTLGIMLILRIITPEARYIIPLSGMIISNSMNAVSIAFNRLGSDLKSNRLMVETSLALGKNWRVASKPLYQNAVKASMISILNFLKTVGIVALPGAMTGMILAGTSPLKAVLIQLIVGYMLLSSVTISAIISAELSVRKFFNSSDQYLG
ncbi:MAG: iron export ABC transporter permease subunit FetB [Candidatus Zixiibacteriota bacterium]